VRSLVLSGSTLFVGGSFTTLGGQPRLRIGALPTTGSGAVQATDWNPGANGIANALALSGSTLFVGGNFLTLGGQVRNYIGAVPTEGSGSVSATDWNPGVNNVVGSVTLSGPSLFIAGDFTSLGGVRQCGFGKLSTTSSGVSKYPIGIHQATPTAPTAKNNIINGKMYVGKVPTPSGFSVAGLDTRSTPVIWENEREGIAAFSTEYDTNYVGLTKQGDTLTWKTELGNLSATTVVNALVVSGSSLFVGGTFASASYESFRSNFVVLSTETGSNGLAQIKEARAASSTVYSMLLSGSTLFMGGAFTSFFNPARGFLQFGVTGSQGDEANLEKEYNTANTVYTQVLLPDGGKIIGGLFTAVLGQIRRYIARINEDGTLHPWSPTFNGIVRALALSGSTLFAGGDFTTVTNEPRTRICSLPVDGSGSVSPNPWAPSLNATVNSLVVFSSSIYAGGSFTTGSGGSRLAVFPTEGSGSVPLLDNSLAASATVNSLVLSGTTLFVGGNFSTLGTTSLRLAGYNVTGSSEVERIFNVNNTVRSIVQLPDGGAVIGGDFTTVSGITRNRIARINQDGTLHPWNPGATGAVYALELSGSTIFAGGQFTTFGGVSRRIAAISLDAPSPYLPLDWNAPSILSNVFSLVSSGTTLFAGIVGGVQTFSTLDVGTAAIVSGSVTANNSVTSFGLSGSSLFMGGAFTTLSNRAGCGSFFGITGSTPAASEVNFNNEFNVNNNVSASVMLPDGGTIIGGNFTSVHGVSRNALARINSDNTVHPWNPGIHISGSIKTMLLSGSSLFVGGDFYQTAALSTRGLCKINVDTGVIDSWAGSATNISDFDENLNCEVNAFELSGTTLFVGGNFTRLGGISAKYSSIFGITGSVGADVNWERQLQANNAVLCSTYVDDDLIVGGNFTSILGQNRQYIARITPSGTLSDWNPGANNAPLVFALSGTTLFVGGTFSTLGGQSRSYIGALPTTGSGAVSATAWNPGANSSVSVFALSGTTLFVGGNFSTLGGQTRAYMGAVPTTGSGAVSATAWNPGISSLPTVSAFALSGSTLFVGGAFIQLGGQSRTSIGAVPTTGSGNPATTWNPGAVGSVRSLDLSGSTLFVGGNFSTLGGQPRNYIGALPTTGSGAVSATAWNPGANGDVFDFALSGSTLFVGGNFNTLGGQSRSRIGALPTTGGGSISATAWNPGSTSNLVQSLSTAKSKLFAGGYYTTLGGQSRSRIGALPTTGSGIISPTDWNPGAANAVYALELSGSTRRTLFVGGAFSGLNSLGGQSRAYIGAIPATGSVIAATNWNPGADNAVRALEVSGSVLFVGGQFSSSLGGQSRAYIGAVPSTGSGAVQATAWNPGANGIVNSLALSGSTLFAGGHFSQLGGQERFFAGSLPATGSGAVSAANWNPRFNGIVDNIAISGSRLVAGGRYAAVLSSSRGRLGSISTRNNQVSSWSSFANNVVNEIVPSGSNILVGGLFTQLGGDPVTGAGSLTRNRLGALPSGGSSVTPTAWNPNLDSYVNSIAVSGSTVYIAGAFSSSMGGTTRSFLGAVSADDGTALPWNPRVNTEVMKVSVSGSSLLAGGAFSQVDAVFSASGFVIGAISAETNKTTGWYAGANNTVNVLEVSGSSLFVGGTFTNLGENRGVRYLGALPTSGNEKVTSTGWRTALDSTVNSLATSGSVIFAGCGGSGSFNGTPRSGLIAFPTTGSTLVGATGWDPKFNSNVLTLAITGSKLFAGGGFTGYNVTGSSYLTAMDTESRQLTGWVPQATNNIVRALALSGTTLFAGGDFTTLGGLSRAGIGALPTTGSQAMPATAWNPGVSGFGADVYALAVSGSTLFVGGNFDILGSTSRLCLGAVPTEGSGSVLATGWNPSPRTTVGELLVGNVFGADRVLAGGQNMTPTTAPSADFRLATTNTLRMTHNVEGNIMKLFFQYRATSPTGANPGSGNYLIRLPSGWIIDTEVVQVDSVASYTTNYSNNLPVGTATITTSNAGDGGAWAVVPVNPFYLALVGKDPGSTEIKTWGANYLPVTASNLNVTFTATIPVKWVEAEY
jgi:hypothetical protein